MKFCYVLLIVMILHSNVVKTDNLQTFLEKFILKPVLSKERDGTEVSPRVEQKDSTEKKAVYRPRSEDVIINLRNGLAAEKHLRVQLQHAMQDLKDKFVYLEQQMAKMQSNQNVQEKFTTLSEQIADLQNEAEAKRKQLFEESLARENLQNTVQDLQSSMTMCESGLILSDYCYPWKGTACFNKEKTALFRLNFVNPPAVSFGLVHLDMSNAHNTRVSLHYSGHPKQPAKGDSLAFIESEPKVYKDSVKVKFYCWHDGQSECYMASVSWMACGAVRM